MGGSIQKPIFSQNVISVEERCIDLTDPSNLQSGKHSFIIATTESGQLIKYELLPSGHCEVDYEYQDWTPSQCFRKGTPKGHITVNEVTRFADKFFRKESSEHGVIDCRDNFKYTSQLKPAKEVDISHMFNCQQASRELFNEVCCESDTLLRNDYLLLLGAFTKKSARFKFMRPDLCHDLIVNHMSPQNEPNDDEIKKVLKLTELGEYGEKLKEDLDNKEELYFHSQILYEFIRSYKDNL